jgi:hypothetical protein
MNVSREAFDLFSPACRWNFMSNKRRWRRLWFWKLVVSDTWNRVCSKAKPGDER